MSDLPPASSSGSDLTMAISFLSEQAEKERQYFDRLLKRTIQILSLILTLVIGLFAFAGWRTFKDIQSQVTDQLQNELVSRFKRGEIDRVIQGAAADQAGKQIGSVLESRVSVAVSEEVRKHQAEIEATILTAAGSEGRTRVALLASAVPPGTVVAFAGVKIPIGWIPCDGRTLPRDEYVPLYDAIGQTYGKGNAPGTFNVPDYRGRFLRGLDSGANRDLERAQTRQAIGSVQNDGVGPHVHPIPVVNRTIRQSWGPYSGFALADEPPLSTRNISESTSTGRETRPKNVAVNWIIKF